MEDAILRNMLTYCRKGQNQIIDKFLPGYGGGITKKFQEMMKHFSLHENGHLLYRNQYFVVPRSMANLCLMICHQSILPSPTVHHTPEETYRIANTLFFWPRLKNDVRKFCRKCPRCSALKSQMAQVQKSLNAGSALQKADTIYAIQPWDSKGEESTFPGVTIYNKVNLRPEGNIPGVYDMAKIFEDIEAELRFTSEQFEENFSDIATVLKSNKLNYIDIVDVFRLWRLWYPFLHLHVMIKSSEEEVSFEDDTKTDTAEQLKRSRKAESFYSDIQLAFTEHHKNQFDLLPNCLFIFDTIYQVKHYHTWICYIQLYADICPLVPYQIGGPNEACILEYINLSSEFNDDFCHVYLLIDAFSLYIKAQLVTKLPVSDVDIKAFLRECYLSRNVVLYTPRCSIFKSSSMQIFFDCYDIRRRTIHTHNLHFKIATFLWRLLVDYEKKLYLDVIRSLEDILHVHNHVTHPFLKCSPASLYLKNNPHN